MKTLTERIAEDNIRIVWGEDNDVSEIIRSETISDGRRGYVWKLVLASDISASTIEVEFGNSVVNGLDNPDVIDPVHGLVSNATEFESEIGTVDFLTWAREYMEFGPKALDSSVLAWDHVEDAWETYQANVKKTAELRTFLGEKYDAYLYETEFDV